MFYISKIILYSGNGVQSHLYLKPGLNIIYGESNTGKSMILDCIDYMFGARDHRFESKLDIEKIELSLYVNGNLLIMNRAINSKKISIESNVPGIESDMYSTNSNAQKSISSVWLKIMGINGDVKIIQTLTGKLQKLTLRTFYHVLLISEQRVQTVGSILSSENGFTQKVATNVLSSLLYFATGKNYLPKEAGKTKDTRKERKEAVKSFVDRSMSKLADKRNSELHNMSNESPAEIQKKIEKLIDDIGAVEGALAEAVNESHIIGSKILNLDSQFAECKVLKNRNISLQTQYSSDIKRLTFIVEGDIHNEEMPKLDCCPFCNGKLEKVQEDSCLDAALAEVNKIEAQMKDLQSVQDALDAEMIELTAKRDAMIAQRKIVEEKIRAELRPQISLLRSHLASFTMALSQYKAKEMIESFSQVLTKELEVTEQEESVSVKINIQKIFEEVYGSDLNSILNGLLQDCNYHNMTGARFDSDDYDVVVNGHFKKSQGKGFRAFLNTVMAIALQNWLDDFGVYKFGLLVIDSPILSLKEREDDIGEEHMSESMKVGLFNYLLRYQNTRQTIIIENEIPNLDYSSANLQKFTKDENSGRYGLISRYRE